MEMDIETMLMLSFTTQTNGLMVMVTWSEITPTNVTKTLMDGMILMATESAYLPIYSQTTQTNGLIQTVMELGIGATRTMTMMGSGMTSMHFLWMQMNGPTLMMMESAITRT